MNEFPGRAERATARALVERLPPRLERLLIVDGVDLRSTAEHVLYTALRHPGAHPAPTSVRAVMRALGRLGVALRETASLRSPGRHGGLAVLVTQPVHVRLFAPIADRLERLAEPRPLLVTARTGVQPHDELARMVDLDLRGSLRPTDVPALASYAIRVAATVRSTPKAWGEVVERGEAARLTRVLRAALPRLALDAARLAGLASGARPRVIACFSEAGILARIVPAVAAAHGIPSADLPHAEAADPWGSAGMGYDAVGVYGPRAASVLELAGIDRDRVVALGPLPYDALLADAGDGEAAPPDEPRRVLFASQPVDAVRPYLAEPVKRLALGSAAAMAGTIAPAELVVLPHPTEDREALARLVAAIPLPRGVQVVVDPPGQLHARLRGAFALVTASSQSVFEAVVAGVPAIAVHPPGSPPPVTYVEEGIALGAESEPTAAGLARRLADADERRAILAAARATLDRRIGPLDGRAAERAARWLDGLAR